MSPELALRIAERYARGSRATRGYVAAKLRSDPVVSRLIEIGGEARFGAVADVGCGRGQCVIALLEAEVAESAHGFDWDEDKIAAARAAAVGLSARFDVADVRSCELPPCDTVLLIDVLHYLSGDEQDALLDRAAAARRAVLVRELDPDRGWRSALTRAQEAVTTRLGYNAGERLEYRPISSISTRLEQRGFRVVVEEAWGRTPFANVLVRASRS